MDVDTPWRRKRPSEDEEYQVSKRHLSEKFFNMQISLPPARGLRDGRPVAQQVAEEGGGGDEFDFENKSMADLRVSSDALHGTAAAAATAAHDDGDDIDLESLDDVPCPRLSRGDTDGSQGAGGGPTPHPFLRAASSTVDEKVDDWVRESRQRLVADASTDATVPDLSRALILYKPVESSGGEGHEGGGDGEGGGGPTPSPRTGGDGGDEITAAGAGSGIARVRPLARNEQCAGSGTAEPSSGPAGGGGGGSAHVNGLHCPPGGLFGPPRGLCTAVSGGDDAGGAVFSSGVTREVSADEMELDGAREEGGGQAQQWLPFPLQPALSRVGSTRGAPTPELTPEWAARARASSRVKGQDPGEVGEGPGPKPLPSERWLNW